MAELSLQEIRLALETELTVPLWPHVGKLLNLSKNSTYDAAHRGEIATIRVGRLHRAPTMPLRKLLGLHGSTAAEAA